MNSVSCAVTNSGTIDDMKTKQTDGRQYVLDEWRRRWVRLTPEELVRQHTLHYLEDELHYPHGLIAVEHTIEINGMKKRCDAVVYDKNGKPLMLIEFKAQNVELNQKVFDQAAVYNTKLQVPYLMVANGRQIIVCKVESGAYVFAHDVPQYDDL